MGYTPYYTAAVWVGYETPARVSTRYNNPAAHMWQLVMDPIHDGLENTGFTQPSGLTQVSYCLDCGGEATAACQSDPRGARIGTGYVFAEDRPTTVCTCHSLEEGSNSMVRVCVDDPVLDANGEFTGYYHLAGPNCPEVSIRTYSYLNLDRESVGGAVAEDSQYFYSAYVAAAGTEQCTVHGEGGQIIDPDDPNGVEDPNGDPGGSGDEPGTGDPGGDSSGSSSQPGNGRSRDARVQLLQHHGPDGEQQRGRRGHQSGDRPALWLLSKWNQRGGENFGFSPPAVLSGRIGQIRQNAPSVAAENLRPVRGFSLHPPGGCAKIDHSVTTNARDTRTEVGTGWRTPMSQSAGYFIVEASAMPEIFRKVGRGQASAGDRRGDHGERRGPGGRDQPQRLL